MKVKKIAKVLESGKKIAIFIDGTLETEVDKDTLMARFGQYKIKAISGGQFTETRCGKPIEVRPVLCLNLKGLDHE